MLHSASYMWFLITLLAESLFMERFREESTTRQHAILHHSVHMVWVAGVCFFFINSKPVITIALKMQYVLCHLVLFPRANTKCSAVEF